VDRAPARIGMTRRGGTFGIPALLAIASAVALLAGLLGDGPFDMVAWIGLAAPLLVIVACLARPQR
jgi:hypothetical protein